MAPFNLEQIERKIHTVVNRAIEFDGVCFRNVQQRYANQQDLLSSSQISIVNENQLAEKRR
ncbi:hypothetical protein IH992_06160 [Candidatus Poribacteria bacterium]|nr:hypothetical protein [Candidatus Poribacteria bacterium]